ncbi:MAG: PepSY domain-containing protein [Chloroflexia bacterium]|nr:PepSY domain-containing protein [Chloroflexia bacterium]
MSAGPTASETYSSAVLKHVSRFLSLDDDDGETPVAAGTLDDGAELLPQAEITLDQAVEAAQTAASGPVGEVDLEDYRGSLVFNVDVGTEDVKVDAKTGKVLGSESDD